MESTPAPASVTATFRITFAELVDEAPLLILTDPVGALVSRMTRIVWVAVETPRALLARSAMELEPSELRETFAVQVVEASAAATSFPFT